MANLKASKKALRQSVKAHTRNLRVRRQLKEVVKDVLKMVHAKDIAGATKLLPQAFSAIDTACKKYVLHKNNAARKKSRLALAVARIGKH